MTVRAFRRISWLALCVLMAPGAIQAARAQTVNDCEQAGQSAEQAYGLPRGLLLAIGRVESGRWDARLGRVVPWPWSVDASGQGRLFDSGSDAIAAVRALQLADSPSIDVGCFQINLAYHPDAFATLTQAFDPDANARYAAQFLASLRARFGNWQDAVAAYHSATPELGEPYRQRVFASWTGETEVSLVSSVQFTVIAGVRVWGPSTGSVAQRAIATPAADPVALPRVITPGG